MTPALESQLLQHEEARRKGKEEELDFEKKMLQRDQLLYERERMQQLNKKLNDKQIFLQSNDQLLTLKKRQEQEEVHSKLT